MTGGFACPSCKVAVLPGYTKCPKCHGPLPYVKPRRAGTTADAGGTVAEEKASMIAPVAIAVLVAGSIIAFFALRNRGSSDEPIAPAPVAAPVATQPAPPPPPDRRAPPPSPTAASRPAGPSPTAAAGDLEKELRHQRLWSSVTVHGASLEVRSATCADPQMAPAIETARPTLQAAGLTKLRCLEESGRVVFERDL